ncbi:bifunctional ADP-dependent (S)-NAD(P)H-hydrate dehydratase/NAD(P)H-hydrate epimerase [Syntrophotalea acetylenivorans]|uniref:Bifunctional NAD(P)H-hydrate repair enzyme n=1 Tax=Syntrophotalea acetylenivorans TaxID=1842532 RepID=A0A1L3GPR6_9BACT|nr:bifunctional ADP-dependent NAD(P)H-hydrate dehydratase/NAD(P)H-hydrate epimerase [Syntrophotalea acetylenivorans]APG27941.1 bifunctional ADP-dependent (S)-NAD(P)H-hydrate dehydratase/NAD(P)H-hydrate epimerase [Syntrophotalea acetylenivorans]
MNVSTVNQMRAMDRAAIEQYGIAEELLMENAGQAACTVLQSMAPIAGRRVLIFCGLGNNGGDGLVLARKLHSLSAKVQVYLLGDPNRFTGAARLNLDIVRRLPLNMSQLNACDTLADELTDCDTVVDALFGTGLSREISGLQEQVIELINNSGKPVLSLDIPSGVDGDTGQILGTAVQATATVTFGLPKIGNLLYPGFALCGTLHVSHISFPLALTEDKQLQVAINHPPPLPPRDVTGHKGSFGQALFIAGAASYLGAPRFAALSFLKAGGGYSRLATPETIVPYLSMQAGEVVFVPQLTTHSGSIALSNRAALLELAASQDFAVIGPGLSLDPQSQQLVCELVATLDIPLLIDADGISALCAKPEILQQRTAPTVLTPHLGEMARLTGYSITEIEQDKIGILRQAAAKLQAVIVLKGPHTLIGTPDGQIFINLSGNSGMGSAGTGDTLTGTIAAAFCLGLPFVDAVCKGVLLHGLAGDLAAEALGEDGMTAGDILDYLPTALQMERNGLPASLALRYSGPLPV